MSNIANGKAPPTDARIVAIHQPNFFPWLGYFEKIARSDAFVLLDNVQYPKKGGVWTNRVKALINGEARWLTAPIDRNYHGYLDIKDARFDDSQPWRDKLLQRLEMSYRRAPAFVEAMSVVEPLVRNPEGGIARYNEHAIKAVMTALGIPTAKIFVASELAASGASNELLISLTKSLSGTAYMCGGGAEGYQNDVLFADAGIALIYQEFKHPVYSQAGVAAFVPGLSVIDALMNLGVEGVRKLLGTL
jgi:hypothetical protein